MSDIARWTPVDSANTDAPPDGAPENMDPDLVNETLRAIMGAVRRFYGDPEWLDLASDANGDALVVAKETDTSVRITGGDLTGAAVENRRIRLSGGASPQLGKITSSSFGAGDTIVNVDIDGSGLGVVDGATDSIEFYLNGTLRTQLGENIGTDPVLVQAFM